MVAFYRFVPSIVTSFIGLGVLSAFVYFKWIEIEFLIPVGALIFIFYLVERYY